MKRAEAFGKALKAERERREMSQRDFAELLNISHSALGYIETGQRYPRLDTMMLILEKVGWEMRIVRNEGE